MVIGEAALVTHTDDDDGDLKSSTKCNDTHLFFIFHYVLPPDIAVQQQLFSQLKVCVPKKVYRDGFQKSFSVKMTHTTNRWRDCPQFFWEEVEILSNQTKVLSHYGKWADIKEGCLIILF